MGFHALCGRALASYLWRKGVACRSYISALVPLWSIVTSPFRSESSVGSPWELRALAWASEYWLQQMHSIHYCPPWIFWISAFLILGFEQFPTRISKNPIKEPLSFGPYPTRISWNPTIRFSAVTDPDSWKSQPRHDIGIRVNTDTDSLKSQPSHDIGFRATAFYKFVDEQILVLIFRISKKS